LGRGGAGIILAYKENKKYFVRDHGSESSLESFQCKNVSLIQEYVKQHNALDRISSSVNTIRIVTLLTLDGLAIIIGAFIRFGRSGNFIDNMCAGGIGVGVNLKNGTLMRRGIDFRGVVHEKHPDSNFIFEGIQIPFWQETTSLVKEIQLEFPCYKLLGHDIAITESGPKLIEINDSPDNVALEMTFGPILKDKDVRNEFKRHDLLINNLLFRQI
jgi:glutathione synthase/RimK-type ligase-like ATP-grasp enzyme